MKITTIQSVKYQLWAFFTVLQPLLQAQKAKSCNSCPMFTTRAPKIREAKMGHAAVLILSLKFAHRLFFSLSTRKLYNFLIILYSNIILPT